MLVDLTIKEFLEKIASKDPAPGGGSVAALCAALSASLIEMVANLTCGKKGYESVQDQIKDLLVKAFECRDIAAKCIDKDTQAYKEVVKAFKLPKETIENEQKRKQKIQESLKKAASIPMEVAQNAYQIMNIAEQIIEKGNKNAISDASVALILAKTSILSALYNVKINLTSIKDEAFIEQMRKTAQELEIKAKEKEKKVLLEIINIFGKMDPDPDYDYKKGRIR